MLMKLCGFRTSQTHDEHKMHLTLKTMLSNPRITAVNDRL